MFNGVIVRRIGRKEYDGDFVDSSILSQPLFVVEACIVHDDHIACIRFRQKIIAKPIFKHFGRGSAPVAKFGEFLSMTITGNNVQPGKFSAAHHAIYALATRCTAILTMKVLINPALIHIDPTRLRNLSNFLPVCGTRLLGALLVAGYFFFRV